MNDKLSVLKSILEKAYRIESSFESKVNFRAFIEAYNEEEKRMLFKLISDSERHKMTLEKVARNLGFELSEAHEEFKFKYNDQWIFNRFIRLS